MKNTSPKVSRKASQIRGEKVSKPARQIHELIKLGVDTHGGQYTFARMVDHQGVQPPQKLSPAGFIELLKKQLTMAKRVVMVYEAGPYGFALYREVTALGVECLVCAPERLSRGRKRVNDKIDAAELLSRVDRHLAGNTTALRLVRVPTLAQEISRREARERNTYRKERQRWISRGRSLSHTLGISRPGRWWEPFNSDLSLKRPQERYGPEVFERVNAELNRDLEMVDLMQKKLDELTGHLREAARCKSSPAQSSPTQSPPSVPSVRIKGIGPLSNELLDREICDWNRFSNRRQVASYTGLCPGEDSSGDSQRSLSIDKHGNPRLRAVLVELAWLLAKFQPDYRRLERWKWAFESKTAKSMRKKAVVALARQLAVDLWRIKTGRAQPEDLGLKLVA
jgi:transposase